VEFCYKNVAYELLPVLTECLISKETMGENSVFHI
jgi:hypothetical protein